jgi:hypothetical protein
VPGLGGQRRAPGHGEHHDDQRRGGQRGVEQPPVPQREIELQRDQDGRARRAEQQQPHRPFLGRRPFRLVRAVQRRRIGAGQILGRGQDRGPHQVGRLPVGGERGGRRAAGLAGALAVDVDGLVDQRLVAAQPVQHAAQGAPGRRRGSGHSAGLLQGLVGLGPVACVDAQRLLPVDAQAVLVADQQHVRHLSVHVVEVEVQVGGRGDLGRGLVADRLQAVRHAGEGHGGDRGQRHGDPDGGGQHAHAFRRGPHPGHPGHGRRGW